MKGDSKGQEGSAGLVGNHVSEGHDSVLSQAFRLGHFLEARLHLYRTAGMAPTVRARSARSGAEGPHARHAYWQRARTQSMWHSLWLSRAYAPRTQTRRLDCMHEPVHHSDAHTARMRCDGRADRLAWRKRHGRQAGGWMGRCTRRTKGARPFRYTLARPALVGALLLDPTVPQLYACVSAHVDAGALLQQRRLGPTEPNETTREATKGNEGGTQPCRPPAPAAARAFHGSARRILPSGRGAPFST